VAAEEETRSRKRAASKCIRARRLADNIVTLGLVTGVQAGIEMHWRTSSELLMRSHG